MCCLWRRCWKLLLLSQLSRCCLRCLHTHQTMYDFLHSRTIMMESVTVSHSWKFISWKILFPSPRVCNDWMSQRGNTNTRRLCWHPIVGYMSMFLIFQDILVSEGLLEEIGQLLYHRRSSSVIITHSCKIIADLCSSCMGQQVDHGCTSCVPVMCLCL